MTTQPKNVELEAEKTYFWCTCGLSANQPFCDGAHKGSGLKSLHFQVEAPTSAWLCTCKQTKNPPYCDGSHNNA
ncbi:MAG: CDGSH iron-sulfur domain-containing protein [Pseudomonadota bacterium]